MKQKANISIELWASNGIIGFDLSHDHDLDFSRSNMEFAISQPKMTLNIRDVRWPFMTMTFSDQGEVYQVVSGVTSNVGVPSTSLITLGSWFFVII